MRGWKRWQWEERVNWKEIWLVIVVVDDDDATTYAGCCPRSHGAPRRRKERRRLKLKVSMCGPGWCSCSRSKRWWACWVTSCWQSSSEYSIAAKWGRSRWKHWWDWRSRNWSFDGKRPWRSRVWSSQGWDSLAFSIATGSLCPLWGCL